MKILYSNKSLYPFEGGGDESALTLLEYLARDNEISAYYIGRKLENSKIKSYPQDFKQRKGLWVNLFFLRKKWENLLIKAIEAEKPDLIITQDYLIGSSVKVAKRYNIKCIAFLRSYLHISIDNFKTYLPEQQKFGRSSDLIYLIQYPFYKKIVKETQEALKEADLVCSVSEYIKDITLRYCGISSEVIRPFISFKECIANKKGNYITFINPDKHKGVSIFEKIAMNMPDEKFLVIGKEKYKAKSKNVEVLGYIKDKKEIFSKTKLLLVPSIFPDPHPRVCVESMANGIPCIVSRRGGLIEEVNNSGIIVNNLFNINEWIKAIKLFNDNDFYEKMSKKARKKSFEFEDKIQFSKFNLLLNRLFKSQ